MRAATAFYGLFSTKCRKNTVLPRVGLRESCYGFLPFFFNKMLKKYGFATGRTAMFFDLTIFLVITGKNNILQKKVHYGFFP